MENTDKKRQVAYKVAISEILSGTFVEQEGWNPNYVLLDDGRRLSRVNIMAVVVSRSDDAEISMRSMQVDDGSARIDLRFFEDRATVSDAAVGQPVNIIGRVRKYSGQLFINPEIIKPISNTKFIELRRKELMLRRTAAPQASSIQQPVPALIHEEALQEEVIASDVKSPRQQVVEFIKQNDAGSGVDITAIMDAVKADNLDSVIQAMKQSGDIFEIRPGWLKVLD